MTSEEEDPKASEPESGDVPSDLDAQDESVAEQTSRRPISRRWVIAAAVVGGSGVAFALWCLLTRFPPDTEPQGAYLRIAYNVSRGDVSMVFPYLEDEAQHACFTIRDYRRQASDLVDRSYPEPERTRLMESYKAHATAADGSNVWVEIAERRGYIGKLRRDLSGIAKTEIDGERATIQTVHGTRYAFRRRANAMWGLSLFTADLTAEAERAARDFDVVKRAAADYDRAGK